MILHDLHFFLLFLDPDLVIIAKTLFHTGVRLLLLDQFSKVWRVSSAFDVLLIELHFGLAFPSRCGTCLRLELAPRWRSLLHLLDCFGCSQLWYFFAGCTLGTCFLGRWNTRGFPCLCLAFLWKLLGGWWLTKRDFSLSKRLLGGTLSEIVSGQGRTRCQRSVLKPGICVDHLALLEVFNDVDAIIVLLRAHVQIQLTL